LPIVLTSHGTVNYEGRSAMIVDIYNSIILKWMLRSVEKIIALTKTQAQILETLGADRKCIAVIPNGIDLAKIHNFDQPYYFGNLMNFKDYKIILYVGSLIPRKGISYLIEAMRYVDPDAILLIAGGSINGHNGYDHTLKSQAKSLGSKKNIIFLGRVSNEELECLYNIADIFVLPSLSEGLPYTLIEAMSYKKCVIATNIAGNNDVIRNLKTGLLVNPKDPWELSDKINFLIAHDELRLTLGISARREIESHYDLNKVYRDTKKIYAECL
jgi:glycosyltransferase involved in cell wall biosynthesis